MIDLVYLDTCYMIKHYTSINKINYKFEFNKYLVFDLKN